MDDKIILVFYISIVNVRSEDVPTYVSRVASKIMPSDFKGEIIIIPVQSETRIECINPKYITDEDLIKTNNLLIYELNHMLKNQIELYKKE